MKTKKFVLWLHNHTDRRDDEWIVIWAKTLKEAQLKAQEVDFNKYRFTAGRIYTAREFRRIMGIAA